MSTPFAYAAQMKSIFDTCQTWIPSHSDRIHKNPQQRDQDKNNEVCVDFIPGKPIQTQISAISQKDFTGKTQRKINFLPLVFL
jgi:hypothetical protein